MAISIKTKTKKTLSFTADEKTITNVDKLINYLKIYNPNYNKNELLESLLDYALNNATFDLQNGKEIKFSDIFINSNELYKYLSEKQQNRNLLITGMARTEKIAVVKDYCRAAIENNEQVLILDIKSDLIETISYTVEEYEKMDFSQNYIVLNLSKIENETAVSNFKRYIYDFINNAKFEKKTLVINEGGLLYKNLSFKKVLDDDLLEKLYSKNNIFIIMDSENIDMINDATIMKYLTNILLYKTNIEEINTSDICFNEFITSNKNIISNFKVGEAILYTHNEIKLITDGRLLK